MSGGFFNYDQYKIGEIADELREIIRSEGNCDSATLEKFYEALNTLERAKIMAQRIDWLLSCDDGVESFLKRWDEDLDEQKTQFEKFRCPDKSLPADWKLK
jgi:hypothetical protein